MSQFTENNHKSFTAGGALALYVRVKLSAGVLAVAAHADKEIGVVTRPVFAANVPTDVLLRTANGTCPMVASGAITAGALIYTDDAGQVSATQGSGAFLVGIALQAATAAGDVIEVLRASAEA